MLLSHLHTRLLLPGLAQLTAHSSQLTTHRDPAHYAPPPRNYSRALDQLSQEAGLAA